MPTSRAIAAAAGRAALRAFGGAIAVVALVLAGGLLALRTERAQRGAARLAAERAAGAIEGRLRLGAVTVRGALEVCAKDLVLDDPLGRPALRAEEACAALDLLALARKQARVRWLRIAAPRIEWTEASGAAPGAHTTTLQLALAPRRGAAPGADAGPSAWAVEVAELTLERGEVALRSAPGAEPRLAVGGLAARGARLSWTAARAGGRLELTAAELGPQRLPARLLLDAALEGGATGGRLRLDALALSLGQSALQADGDLDLAARTGTLHLRQLRLAPRELEQLLPQRPGAGGAARHALPLHEPLEGKAELLSDGQEARLLLELQGGGGRVTGELKSTLGLPLRWSVALSGEQVDPARLLLEAPPGRVSARLDVRGKGVPEWRDGGLRGDVKVHLHLGPARLDGVGPITADLDGSLLGQYLIVKRLTADALGVAVRGEGAWSREELSMDLAVDAPDLAAFGRAAGALAHKPALRLEGAARLTARLTGSPRRPDAQVHVRAPRLVFGSSLEAIGLAGDGALQGDLRRPKGTLAFSSERLTLGGADLGAPRVTLDLAWPAAWLRVEARVRGEDGAPGQGALELSGQATLDQRGDGLLLSDLFVSWPGNILKLQRPAHLKLGARETVLEPVALAGPFGGLSLAATLVRPGPRSPGRVEAALGLTRFDLDRLPEFALPPGLGLKGVVDAQVGVTGDPAAPDVDAALQVEGLEAGRLHGLSGRVQAQVHRGRARLSGELGGPLGSKLRLKASLPVAAPARAPRAPLDADLWLQGVDLAQAASLLPARAGAPPALAGTLGAHLVAKGTLERPALDLTVDAGGLGAGRLHGARLLAALRLAEGRAVLDGVLSLGGAPALKLEGRLPFDLGRALADPAEARRALERPGTLGASTAGLTLEQLARAGLLPEGSGGPVRASLALAGTLAAPRLSFEVAGDALQVGPARELGLALKATFGEALALEGTARIGEARAGLTAQLAVRAAEAVALARGGFARGALDPLLERALRADLEVERLVVGRLAALAPPAPGAAPRASAPVQGTLGGKVALRGSPQRPEVVGTLRLGELVLGAAPVGAAELHLEADRAGATLHLGLDPPGPLAEPGAPPRRGLLSRVGDALRGRAAAASPLPRRRPGGSLLLHARLDADLSARALLDDGVEGILGGALSGHVAARALELDFLSNAAPGLRRAAGTLEADVALQGLLGRPSLEGEAHLKRGLAELAGAGVFEDLGLDATFAPREIVFDRLTGSAGGGHFSAVLVLGRRTAAEDDDRIEFTGELHLGDAEAARDRVGRDGRPLAPRPVPLRADGEERADLEAEASFFGDYEQGQVAATVQIPRAWLRVRQLPEKKLPKLAPDPTIWMALADGRRALAGLDPALQERRERVRREATLRADLQLDLQALRVEAADFDLPVTSRMHVSWDARNPDAPVADGTLSLAGGTFSALGRRFEIDEATITETGGDVQDPELEIQARYENPQASVLVLVSGTAKDPQIDLSSSPAMDQDAIAFFLATGRLQGRATQQGGGVDLSNAATSVLGAVLFGQLRKSLSDALPIDVFTVETGGGGRSAQASVGKYIGERLFVGYRQRLSAGPAENSVEGRAELLLGRSFAAEGSYGDKAKSVSVLWSMDW